MTPAARPWEARFRHAKQPTPLDVQGRTSPRARTHPRRWSETNPGKDGSPFYSWIFDSDRTGAAGSTDAPRSPPNPPGTDACSGVFGKRFRTTAHEAQSNDRSRSKSCLAAAGGCDAAPRQNKSSAAGRGKQAKDRLSAATDGGRCTPSMRTPVKRRPPCQPPGEGPPGPSDKTKRYRGVVARMGPSPGIEGVGDPTLPYRDLQRKRKRSAPFPRGKCASISQRISRSERKMLA